VPDLNPTKYSGYLRLFEAAWNDDLETVKSLTLAPWQFQDEKPLQAPLQIAVRDGNGFSPFSIAVLQGHHKLAQTIVEICIAQYHQDDGSLRKRWNMHSMDSDDEGYSDEDDDNKLPIYSELVSDKYTIDSVGEVSDAVKSDVLPLMMIEWPCYTTRLLNPSKEDDTQYSLLEHAVVMNDMDLLKFIIQLGAEQQAALADGEDDQKFYTIARPIFHQAIKRGRTQMLAEMVGGHLLYWTCSKVQTFNAD
jgi:ankyrin repeat protein